MQERPGGLREEQMMGVRELLTTRARLIVLHGVMQNESESCNTLLALDSISSDPIKIIIDSPGGSLDCAFMLYDTIKMLDSPVYTLGRFCASGAALVLVAGEGRYLMPRARVMLHLPSGQAAGDVREIALQAAEFDKAKETMVALLIEAGVKKTRQELLDDIDREHWMDAKQAIAYGVADKIMTPAVMKEWLGKEA